MRRRVRNVKKFNIILLFVISILSVGVGYAYLSTTLSIKGNITARKTPDNIVITGNDKLTISSPTINKWSDNNYYKYQYRLILKNIGITTFDNYKVTFTFNDNITAINTWNHEYQIEGRTVVIKNASYNLLPNGEVEINFIATTSNIDIKILSIKLETIITKEEIDPSLFNVEFVKTGGWGSYVYQYDVKLTNKSTKVINSWELEFTMPNNTNYVSGWNGNFSQNGQNFKITNASYNGRVGINQTVTFGIQISTDIVNYIPSNIKIVVRQ